MGRMGRIGLTGRMGNQSERVVGLHYETGRLLELELLGDGGGGGALGRVRAAEAGGAGQKPDRAAGELPIVMPGLVDLQVNGFVGVDVSNPGVTPDDLRKMTQALWARGVTKFCPTICTSSAEDTLGAVRAIARADAEGAFGGSFAGIHLEGPFISPEDGPRGAHAAGLVRKPDWDEFARLQDAAGGRIRMVTLAPELEGALGLVERLAETGVLVAIGHTAADGDVIQDAVQAGARPSTHLGNGAHAFVRRHPNYIWDQLACDDLAASLIADGHHLGQAVFKCFVRCKGLARTVLVSDSVSLGGLAPGHYRVLGADVDLTPDGAVRLPGTGFLAGSACSLDMDVPIAARFAGLQLAAAIDMASFNPARLLGLPGHVGRVKVDSSAGEAGGVEPAGADHTAARGQRRADLVLARVTWNNGWPVALSVEMTVVEGAVVWRRPGGAAAGANGSGWADQ